MTDRLAEQCRDIHSFVHCEQGVRSGTILLFSEKSNDGKATSRVDVPTGQYARLHDPPRSFLLASLVERMKGAYVRSQERHCGCERGISPSSSSRHSSVSKHPRARQCQWRSAALGLWLLLVPHNNSFPMLLLVPAKFPAIPPRTDEPLHTRPALLFALRRPRINSSEIHHPIEHVHAAVC
jgi:hypothetical protein